MDSKTEILNEIVNLLKHEAEAVQNIPVSDSFIKAVDLIYQKVHIEGGKVIASGMGKAGQIAENIATTLSSTGTPAVYLHPSEAQHGDLGVIRENDLLIVLSNSGRTREIIELVQLTHNLYEKVPLIVITGNPEGELPKIAEVSIFIFVPGNCLRINDISFSNPNSSDLSNSSKTKEYIFDATKLPRLMCAAILPGVPITNFGGSAKLLISVFTGCPP